jgi:hypothetical protein
MMLMIAIGEGGDAFDDPTQPWPTTRVRVVMGTLTLTSVAEDQAAACEHISFNPCRLLHGIEASDDPSLHACKYTYEVSRKMRGGVQCPFNGSLTDGALSSTCHRTRAACYVLMARTGQGNHGEIVEGVARKREGSAWPRGSYSVGELAGETTTRMVGDDRGARGIA